MTYRAKLCPRCGSADMEFPALSRRDNKTDICSTCGTEEALIDAIPLIGDRYVGQDVMEREYNFVTKLLKTQKQS